MTADRPINNHSSPAADGGAVVAAFTEMAARYEETVDRELRMFWGVGYEAFIRRLLARLDVARAAHVLDVATGRGVIPVALTGRRDWQGRIVGLDITPAMLEGAHAQVAAAGAGDAVRLTCGSGLQLPFSDRSFDAVICALATHHMDGPSLLREIRRVLRPGGQLLVADVALAAFWGSAAGKVLLHAMAWWYGRQEGAVRMAAEMAALPNMRTPAQWRTLLDDAGFTQIEAVTIPARHRWYPPGVLIDARNAASPGSL